MYISYDRSGLGVMDVESLVVARFEVVHNVESPIESTVG